MTLPFCLIIVLIKVHNNIFHVLNGMETCIYGSSTCNQILGRREVLFIEDFLFNESICITFMEKFNGSVIIKKTPPNFVFNHIYIIPLLIIIIQCVKNKTIFHQCVFKLIILAFELKRMFKKNLIGK
jgi:hypothetical protein